VNAGNPRFERRDDYAIFNAIFLDQFRMASDNLVCGFKQVIDRRGLTLCSTSFPPLRCIIFSGQEVANKGRGLPLASRKDPGVRY
jgi:hypothetical protein